MRGAVKEMAAAANRARTYREQCSQVLGAAIAASLALQEALAARGASNAHPALLLHAGAEVRVAVSLAQGLVHKWGRQTPLEALLRRSGRADVDSRFAAVEAQLHAAEDLLWRHIDPDNRLRRELRPQQPQQPLQQQPPASQLQSASSVAALPPLPARSAHRLSRQRLRKASQHPVLGLIWFADGEEGGDGCVAWAAHHHIKVVNLSTSVMTVLYGAADGLTAFCHGAAGERQLSSSPNLLSSAATCCLPHSLTNTLSSKPLFLSHPPHPQRRRRGPHLGRLLRRHPARVVPRRRRRRGAAVPRGRVRGDGAGGGRGRRRRVGRQRGGGDHYRQVGGAGCAGRACVARGFCLL